MGRILEETLNVELIPVSRKSPHLEMLIPTNSFVIIRIMGIIEKENHGYIMLSR